MVRTPEKPRFGTISGWTCPQTLKVGTHGAAQIGFRSDDLLQERPFVVKRYSRRHSNEGLAWWSAEREKRALLQLRHEHIIEAVETGQDENGTPYLVVPYFPRGQLTTKELLDISFTSLLQIVQKLTSTLEYIHNSGFVHGDVAVCNVVLTDGYAPVLIDFASSREQQHEHEYNDSGASGQKQNGKSRDFEAEWRNGLKVDRTRADALYRWIFKQNQATKGIHPVQAAIRAEVATRFQTVLRARTEEEREQHRFSQGDLSDLIERYEMADHETSLACTLQPC